MKVGIVFVLLMFIIIQSVFTMYVMDKTPATVVKYQKCEVPTICEQFSLTNCVDEIMESRHQLKYLEEQTNV